MDSRTDLVGEAIKHQIVQRTSGRIQMLEVQVTDTAVVIHGAVPSYYVKQLTLRGVLDVIGSAPSTRVELDVHVMERREEGNSTPGSGDMAS